MTAPSQFGRSLLRLAPVESWPVSLRRVPPLEALLPEQLRHVLPLVESRLVSLRRVLPRVLPMPGLLLEPEPPWRPWHSGAF